MDARDELDDIEDRISTIEQLNDTYLQNQFNSGRETIFENIYPIVDQIDILTNDSENVIKDLA